MISNNDTVAKRALQVSYLGVNFLCSHQPPDLKFLKMCVLNILKCRTKPESFPKTYGTTRVPKSKVTQNNKETSCKVLQTLQGPRTSGR